MQFWILLLHRGRQISLILFIMFVNLIITGESRAARAVRSCHRKCISLLPRARKHLADALERHDLL